MLDGVPFEGFTEDADENNDIHAAKYAHLSEKIHVDRNASRDQLLEQFNRAFSERMNLRKRLKMLKRKNLRVIEKMAKACEKKESTQTNEEPATEPEVKKKKKTEPQAKICPKHLEEVLTYLETQDLLSDQAISVMKVFLGDSLTENITHDSKGGLAKDKEVQMTPAMKTFAKTLLFYSSEAYHMVKELFELPIPTASVSRTWYNMGLGLPGWSSEAFLMLKDEIQKCENSVLHSCILMGEFDLNTSSSLDENEVRGHIDYGTTGDLEPPCCVENLPLAKSALFFMLVPMNVEKKWKIPLAYFLIDTLSPEERANVVMECLWRVYNMGSIAVGVVVDASANSRQTVESLGISFEDLPYPCTSFPHPADGLLNVHVLFDPCHVLDFLRHTWASIAIMVDEKGGAISWKYFTELVKVQETQAGCSEHTEQTATWYWDRSLMRKRLIAQLFTDDVANAMDCCFTSLLLPQFAGCESTVLFIRMISKVLDTFNPKGAVLVAGINSEWKNSIVDTLNYLFVLRDRNGQGIFATNCKAPFVCLYMNLLSILELCKRMPQSAVSLLNLNGLELLFTAIHSRTNWENCPSVCKFTAAYSLTLQEEGFTLVDNIVKVDNYWWLDCLDMANARKGGLAIRSPIMKTENTPPIPRSLTFYPVLLPSELQRFRASQLVMVHTVKRVADVFQCNICIEALQMAYIQDNPTLVLLRKTCGGFIYPSQGVVEVCALADHHLKTEMRISSFDLKQEVFTRRDSTLVQYVCLAVLQSVLDRHRNPFPQLEDHLKECPIGSDHICRLIRVLTASFVLLRLQSVRAWSIHP